MIRVRHVTRHMSVTKLQHLGSQPGSGRPQRTGLSLYPHRRFPTRNLVSPPHHHRRRARRGGDVRERFVLRPRRSRPGSPPAAPGLGRQGEPDRRAPDDLGGAEPCAARLPGGGPASSVPKRGPAGTAGGLRVRWQLGHQHGQRLLRRTAVQPEHLAAYGGAGYPNQQSKAEQIRVAERVRTQSGLGHWPVCGLRLGDPTAGPAGDRPARRGPHPGGAPVARLGSALATVRLPWQRAHAPPARRPALRAQPGASPWGPPPTTTTRSSRACPPPGCKGRVHALPGGGRGPHRQGAGAHGPPLHRRGLAAAGASDPEPPRHPERRRAGPNPT